MSHNYNIRKLEITNYFRSFRLLTPQGPAFFTKAYQSGKDFQAKNAFSSSNHYSQSINFRIITEVQFM